MQPLEQYKDFAVNLAKEAGGKVTDINGNEQRYDHHIINGAIISNGLVHDQLVEVIQKSRANL
ncbi:hypothetical protein HY622_01680 [Candidatus Uhrbacteria bacterium]|nr:hypothetical protein [Candidatus Uhrbacteria bacterium]